MLFLIAMDDGAGGVGAAAAIEGETQAEVVSLRLLALGRQYAAEHDGAVAAVLLLLIGERKVERRLHFAVVGRNGAIGDSGC